MTVDVDRSGDILDKWKPRLEASGIVIVTGGHNDKQPKGVGYAKNQAVLQSHGNFLCFLDADDVMDGRRIEMQLAATVIRPFTITGCQFYRVPAGSTERYTKWANSINQEQLMTQVYTAHGPTVIMPTWFCSRETFDRVGAFNEHGKGTPEDLLFFFEHLRLGGKVFRVDHCLLMYRYHPAAATHSVSQESIWDIRMKALEERVLSCWDSFTIWNAGKQGRRFYRSLSEHNKEKVAQFCDVDVKKIEKGVYIYEESEAIPKPRVPIIHFSKARPPIIICVKMDLTGGSFESNLASLHLIEGKDYVFFS
ncbi:UDP-GlcNAc:betaGal beta-1,3-N-acetylglucosaminyltransferase-like protein 1 isoform X2 [Acanthaster planci]|uniref:UDP-GlcNAc:betaGal beta-1,3-N-acetylglucosaminyltransferase-like protein 1 isoform X2 n=1 Tax=Acanthaster planci TaxID=133434 RepID=A0A8B7XVR3_ACAPL|nr:UDP-GlcNAc:betaGal beta-1,3-N-acetylglucosaminyltransferase-like protein 1 isoform X2 [Acanthaster planci]